MLFGKDQRENWVIDLGKGCRLKESRMLRNNGEEGVKDFGKEGKKKGQEM